MDGNNITPPLSDFTALDASLTPSAPLGTLQAEFSMQAETSATTTITTSQPENTSAVESAEVMTALRNPVEPIPDTNRLPRLAPDAAVLSSTVPQTDPFQALVSTTEEENKVERQLIFSLGEVRYAVPLDLIIEIAELEQYTPVPNVPEWIAGITNLRGDIVSLVDLYALQGEAVENLIPGSNLLVTGLDSEELMTCLVVDRIQGIASINPDQIQYFDKMTGSDLSPFIRGYITDSAGFLCLIDLASLLRSLVLSH